MDLSRRRDCDADEDRCRGIRLRIGMRGMALILRRRGRRGRLLRV